MEKDFHFRAAMLCLVYLFALIVLIDTKFEIYMRVGENRRLLQDYVVFEENTTQEIICDAHIPVEWITDGKFSSYWTEPRITRTKNFYRNALKAIYTSSATGLLSCQPLDRTPNKINQTTSVYVYVNGSSFFAESGKRTINLNKQADLIQRRIIPCRTTLPNLIPILSKTVDRKEVALPNVPYTTKGFTLLNDLIPGEIYKCCLSGQCVEYKILGKSFYVTPNSTTISTFVNVPVQLQCVSPVNLNVTIQNNIDHRVNISSQNITKSFEGGPTNIKTISVMNLKSKLEINCSDGFNQHMWVLFPPPLYAFLGNQSVKYFRERNSFECRINSTNFWAKNAFCENMNNCALKAKCFGDSSCPVIIKPGVPCAKPYCLSIGHSYATGIFECGTTESKFSTTYFTGLDRQLYFLNDGTTVPIEALAKIHEVPQPFYKGLSEPLLLFCSHTLFHLAREAFFSYKFRNGTTREIYEAEKLQRSNEERNAVRQMYLRDVHAVSVKMDPTLDVTEIVCSVPRISSLGFLQVSRKLTIIEASAPQIHGWIKSKTIHTDENVPLVFICNVSGEPFPHVTWTKDTNEASVERNVTTNNLITNGSILTFTMIDNSIEGRYSCYAENGIGNTTEFLEVKVKHVDRLTHFNPLWTILISCLIVMCSIALVTYLYKRRQRQLNDLVRKLSEQEIAEFFKGGLIDPSKHYVNEDAADFVRQLPYNNVYEIRDDALKISEGDILGKGAFGIVYRGTLDAKQSVAIKTVTSEADKEALQNLLVEIKVMIHVGYHPCVIEFIGAVTRNLRNMEVYVVVELCPNGDLLSYLRSLQNPQRPHDQINGVGNNDETNKILGQLFQWSLEVCMGVEHLAKRKIIHGDIATRNVLLDSHLCAKIADFGLSTRVSNYTEYVKKCQSAPLPWRWVALESLQGFRFSYASDVWSVGVTIWEIFTYGNTPYPSMTWNFEFIELLSSGYRLPRPEMCPTEIYAKVLETWNSNASERISLSSLQDAFKWALKDLRVRFCN